MNEVMDMESPVIEFTNNLPERLYRDRFIFPEELVEVFKDTDEIVEAMEREIKTRIKEKTIHNFSNEVILKNVLGPYYNDIDEERGALLKVVDEMKKDMISSNEEKVPVKPSPKRIFEEDKLKKIALEAQKLWGEEAERAGDIAEVVRNSNGEIEPQGNPEALTGRILEIEDDEEDEKEK